MHTTEAAERFETCWGLICHSAMRIPLHKLSKMPFVNTSEPLCNLHSVWYVRNRFVV